jgi:hypothetical protein
MCNCSAIHANVVVVSFRNRSASCTLNGSPLRNLFKSATCHRFLFSAALMILWARCSTDSAMTVATAHHLVFHTEIFDAQRRGRKLNAKPNMSIPLTDPFVGSALPPSITTANDFNRALPLHLAAKAGTCPTHSKAATRQRKLEWPR